jgi:hypothetical protein
MTSNFVADILHKHVTDREHRHPVEADRTDSDEIIEPLVDFDLWKVDPTSYRLYTPSDVVMGA